MAECYELTASIEFQCEPLAPGVQPRLWVVNKTVWDNASITFDVTNTNLIDGFGLASGDELIYIDVPRGTATVPQVTPRIGTFQNTFLHQVQTHVFKNGAAVKAQLEKLYGGNFVVIIENNEPGVSDTGKFEVYGSNSGMTCSEGLRELNNPDTGGAYSVTWASREDASEKRLPLSLLVTDIATTKALLDGLAATAI